MSTLALFYRDTAANKILKGFEYQKLKTLEQWVSNRVRGINELIYCEYEDDIFQLDPLTEEKKFTQVKLYGSKSFNIKSEEIGKALVNFFFLYLKTREDNKPVVFQFETNTYVSKAKGTFEADVLLDWFQNQDHLDELRIGEYIPILHNLIGSQLKARLFKHESDQERIKQALSELESLSDEFWKGFISAIRWNFSNMDTNEALRSTVESINEWIDKLPFSSATQKKHALFSSLYREVSNRLVQDEPEQRRLTNGKLDELTLAVGSVKDGQYLNVYTLWRETPQITTFIFGEYFEVMYSAEYSLMTDYLELHRPLWASLVRQYATMKHIVDNWRRDAVLLWILLSIDQKTGMFLATTSTDEKKTFIRDYFSTSFKYDYFDAVKVHLAIIKSVFGAISHRQINISVDQMNDWFTQLGDLLYQKVKGADNPNEKCEWLMLQMDYFCFPTTEDKKFKYPDLVTSSVNQLVKLLPDASLFNVNKLNGYLLFYIDLLIRGKYHHSVISYLENIVDQIAPFVSKQLGDEASGLTCYERGRNYVQSDVPAHQLKMLELFQRASTYFLKAPSHQLYSASLIDLSHLYMTFNMNLAAKHYALSALLYSIYWDDKDRIQSAIESIIYSDFKQGSWITTLADGMYYTGLYTKMSQFGLEDLNRGPALAFAQLASVVKIMAFISPQLSNLALVYWDHLSGRCGEDIPTLLAYTYEAFNQHGANWSEHLLERLDAPPVNDIGATRIIQFKAFDIVWTLRSLNDETGNKLVEELAALLQVALVELCYYLLAFEVTTSAVTVDLSPNEQWEAPRLLQSGNETSFQVLSGTVKHDKSGTEINHTWHAKNVIWAILQVAFSFKKEQSADICQNVFFESDHARKFLLVDGYRNIYDFFYQHVDSMKQGKVFEECLINFPLRQSTIFQRK